MHEGLKGFERRKYRSALVSAANPLCLLLQIFRRYNILGCMDYVRALAKDPIARKVKLADLLHNLDARRPNGVRSGKYDLYLQAVRYLEKIR